MKKEQRVLYVTNKSVKDKFLIPSIIESYGDIVDIVTSKSQVADYLTDLTPDIVICDRPTFLLSPEQICQVKRQCFNIHPSFLPFNRGYHPNFWSIYDDTPCGVTIHLIDETIDTGQILSQTRVTFSEDDTLRTSYLRLRQASIKLFELTYPQIRSGVKNLQTYSNPSNLGRTNYKASFEGVFDLLSLGWDTSIREVRQLAQKDTINRQP